MNKLGWITKLAAHQPNYRSSYDLWGNILKISRRWGFLKQPKAGENYQLKRVPKIDQKFLQLGRKTVYQETLGNEDCLTDIMGVIVGPFTINNITKATMALKGQGTNNLLVELATDFTVQGKTYKKRKIDTGIDVEKGSHVPLGMPVSVKDGHVRVGISCAACHATVDPVTKSG